MIPRACVTGSAYGRIGRSRKKNVPSASWRPWLRTYHSPAANVSPRESSRKMKRKRARFMPLKERIDERRECGARRQRDDSADEQQDQKDRQEPELLPLTDELPELADEV